MRITGAQRLAVFKAVERWPEGRQYFSCMVTYQVEPAHISKVGLRWWAREDCIDCGGPAAVLAAMRTTKATKLVSFFDILRAQEDLETYFKLRNWFIKLPTAKGREDLMERAANA